MLVEAGQPRGPMLVTPMSAPSDARNAGPPLSPVHVQLAPSLVNVPVATPVTLAVPALRSPSVPVEPAPV